MNFVRISLRLATLLAVISTLIVSKGILAETTNSTCPALVGEKVDENIFTDYHGKRVYFCCNKCRREFISAPEKYIKNLPQFASNDSSSSNNRTDHEDIGEKYHNHNIDHAEVKGEKFSLIAYAGKFHPLATHFPIALVITSFLLSLMSLILRNPAYEATGIKIIYLAGLTAVVTALLGLAAGAGATFPADMKEYFVWHRRLGISSGLLTLLSSYFAHRYERKRTLPNHLLYRLILLITAVLVAITGHLGATLVYGPEHFAV